MSRSLKVLSLLLALLTSHSAAWAQKSIKGTVTDAKTGQTLPATNILVKGTYRGTITNENGVYSLSIPDSLLPATLVVRYIGYHSQQRMITVNTSSKQDFALEPAINQLQEITVTDEDPGGRIMREVIKRKQQWRKKLTTYKAEAYTRQTLANDTSIVSISESASEVFWKKDNGHREVLKSKRQTANIKASQNFAGVSYLPNMYDDNVTIAGFDLVGVTNPKALDYYDFKLIDQTSLNDQTVYKIQVIPDRKLQPLFKGTVYVLADEFALLQVDLKPNSVVTFPPPVKSFTTSYKQQFNNFGKDFWLPVDMRIGGDIKISMVGLNFPLIKFKQLSRITDYKVNVPLPDSLYKKDKLFSVDSTTIKSDSLITKRVDTVPLSQDEQKAYSTLDSTATLEKAFKPSGFLSHFVNNDDNESDSGSGWFHFLDKVPGNISPNARYNRVDELFAGLKYRVDITDRLELRGHGGYSTGYKKWSYGGGLSFQWLDEGSISSTLGWDYKASTATRYRSDVYTPAYVLLPNLFGNRGYFDYYRSEGFRVFSKWQYQPADLSMTVGLNSYDQTSLPVTTAYDLLGNSDNFRINPPINEGHLQSIDLTTGYNLDEGYNFGVTGQKSIRFKIEHSSEALGSDFNFTRYTTDISWSFPTFYKRRFLSNMLYINVRAGTYSGDLPFQKLGIIDASLDGTAPFGVLKTIRGRPYEGEQYLNVNVEHNFRTIPFEMLGLHSLVEHNIGLIIFGGTAKTWGPSWTTQQITKYGYRPHYTDGIHWEAGASINGILGLFRVDFAARLDQPAFLVNIGVARLF